jgi:molybdopterin-biosynthesis enzyme MoeA-like protein
MAKLPVGADIIDNDVMAVGGFYIDNIFVMAGVPKIFKSMFLAIKNQLRVGDKIRSMELNLTAKESLIAHDFAELQKRYPEVSMGSYPNTQGTSLVFRSSDYEKLEQSFLEMKKNLEKNGSDLIISAKT